MDAALPGAGLRSTTKAYLAWAVICLVWGTTFLANKVGIASIPPLRLCAMRFVTAGLLLQAVARLRRRAGAPPVPVRLGLAGVVTLGVGTGVTVWAQQWLPSGLTAVLTAATPFSMVLLEALAPGGARPSRPAVAGLLLGLCGLLVIAAQQPAGTFRTDYLWAVGTVLLSGLAWSAGSIFTRHQASRPDPIAVASWQTLSAGVALFAGSLVAGERLPEAIDARGWAMLAYLVVFGSCVAYVCYLYALRHLPVVFVSTHTYVNPVLALWLGWLLLEEPLTAAELAATALILGGLLLTRTPDALSNLDWRLPNTVGRRR